MTFLTMDKPKRVVGGVGPKDAKILILGEAPGAYEDSQGIPFAGPAGGVLEQCLHAAGIIRSDVYITNVVKTRPAGNKIDPFFNTTTGQFSTDGMKWVEKLREEIADINPNVVIACGATAMAAMTCGTSGKGLAKVMKLRGYFLESVGFNRVYKVMPTIHPAAALRGMYIYRYMISTDMKKAKVERGSPDLIRPQRQLVFSFNEVTEALDWLRYYSEQPIVCFDIEVLNYEVACIGFSSEPGIACTIPLSNRWRIEDELLLWRGIQEVLGNPHSIKVVQNGIFDIQFLLTRCGIETLGPIHDTMVAHSVMFPELPKGLGFLGSVYCGTQSFWKDMVKFENIKEES